MAVVGLIPARGGSKGVPGKNIKSLGGKPLICWTIDAALGSSLLDRVIVSTDCEHIAAVAEAAGAEVPFLRPSTLAQDDTPDQPVIKHMLDWWRGENTEHVKGIVYLRPTTPFKTPETINRCIETLMSGDALSCVRTVTRVDGVHHPYWMVKIRNEMLESFVDGVDIGQYYRRQLLPPCYRLNGVVDVFTPEAVLKGRTIYGEHTGYLEIDDTEAVDIDRPIDFAWCEFLVDKWKMAGAMLSDERRSDP